MMTVESSVFARLPIFRRRKFKSMYTEYPNHKKSYADYFKRFFTGEMSTFSNEESEDEVTGDALTRQKLEEILRSKFEDYHKKTKKMFARRNFKN